MTTSQADISGFSVNARDRRFRGITAPFVDEGLGPFAAKDTGHVIWSSIINILMTPIGTRVWLLQFGSNLTSLIWEPNDQQLEALARDAVFGAIQRWEPRVRLLDMQIYRNEFDIHLTMKYEIIRDNRIETRTLNFDARSAGVVS